MDNTYLTLNYNTKDRWLSYWHQISEALEILPDSVLVVGKGSGVTENAIRQLSNGKTDVITLDINNAVCSDVVGDVVRLPFRNDSFDVIVCCQVLEHIPFEQFPLILHEMHRVARRRIILSLPHKRKHIKIAYRLPFLKERTFILKHPLTVKRCTSKQHRWEIGRGVSRKQVLHYMSRLFSIEKEYLNEMNCEHRFFVLSRKN
ncbi:MAG: class I SAM-dependent methyltransferase [Nitrospiraceae bacterium]|nr:MAG: class I SAM-dependent methyltransferase [Nitrospiraceae bacterium]